MKIRRSKWVSRIGVVGLAVGCLALAGFGSGATPAEAAESQSARFVVLEAMNNEGVLDNETGLVWETIPTRAQAVWKSAAGICAKKTVGGKKDWRLPDTQRVGDPGGSHDISSTRPPDWPSLFQHRVSWLLDVDGARRLYDERVGR